MGQHKVDSDAQTAPDEGMSTGSPHSGNRGSAIDDSVADLLELSASAPKKAYNRRNWSLTVSGLDAIRSVWLPSG